MTYYVLMVWRPRMPDRSDWLCFGVGAAPHETLSDNSEYIHTNLEYLQQILSGYGFVQLEPDTPPDGEKNFFIVSVEVDDVSL